MLFKSLKPGTGFINEDGEIAIIIANDLQNKTLISLTPCGIESVEYADFADEDVLTRGGEQLSVLGVDDL